MEKSTKSASRRESLPKGFTTSCVRACDDTGVRIQGQPCTTCLVTMSLQILQKVADVELDKRSEHRRNSKNRRGRRRNAASTVNAADTGGSTSTATCTPMPSASAGMQVESSLRSIPMLATPNMSGSSAAFVDTAPFCWVRLQKSHFQAQCPFIPSLSREKRTTQGVNNLRNPALNTVD